MNVGLFYHKFIIEHYFEYHCIIFLGFHNGKRMRKRLYKLGLYIMKGTKMELFAYDITSIMYNITNLTSNDLVMDQSCKVHSFIGSYVLCTKYHALESMIDTQINVLVDEICMNEWMNFTLSYIFVGQTCFQCMIFMCKTYKLMNEWTLYDFQS